MIGKNRLVRIGMIGVLLSPIGALAGNAQTASSYVTPISTQFTQMQSDLVSAIPACAAVMLVLTGGGLLIKLFKKMAK